MQVGSESASLVVWRSEVKGETHKLRWSGIVAVVGHVSVVEAAWPRKSYSEASFGGSLCGPVLGVLSDAAAAVGWS